MKKCPNCQNVYEDSKGFCPKCGAALVDAGVQQETVTPTPAKTGNGFFAKWGALLLGIVGLIICWELSALFGCAIAVAGAFLGWQSENIINKVGSIILAVVCAIMTIMVME